MECALTVSKIISLLLDDQKAKAKQVIENYYPFEATVNSNRKYSDKEKIHIFIRDGFIDRYSGKRMVNPGALRCISFLFPKEFPYHPHWKMDQCHIAYWDLLPTIDHITPIARGGSDTAENWVTTSMLNNSIKCNWTLDELRWRLYCGGNLNEWDGLTMSFIRMVEKMPELQEDSYIQRWHHISKTAFSEIQLH